MRTARQWATAVLVAGCLAVSPAPAAPPGSAAPGPPPIGSPAPNFALTTQQNDRLWLTQLRGRAVVLAFGCASCGACTGLLTDLGTLARELGDAAGRRVFFVVVTVDPAHDTPAALRELGRHDGRRAPAWLWLTEDRAGQVDVVTRRYGVSVRRAGGTVEVADCAATLIDGDGRIRARRGAGEVERLGADLRALLRQG